MDVFVVCILLKGIALSAFCEIKLLCGQIPLCFLMIVAI